MTGPELARLTQLLARLPGLGPRSARRAALALLTRRDELMVPLADALAVAAAAVQACEVCGNFDTVQPCAICADPTRDAATLCVVEGVAELWALERARVFRGRYHVLGGTLSALHGISPEDLAIPGLVARARASEVTEVILALGATVDGQATAHYVTDRLAGTGVSVTRLAHGVPVGGALDLMDEGTLATALLARRPLPGAAP